VGLRGNSTAIAGNVSFTLMKNIVKMARELRAPLTKY
jgi:hypothetical protein